MAYRRFLASSQVQSWHGTALRVPARPRLPPVVLDDDFNRLTGDNSIGNTPVGNFAPEYLYQGTWQTDGANLWTRASQNEAMIAWNLGITSYTVEAVLGAYATTDDCGLMVRVVDRLNVILAYPYSGNTALYVRTAGTWTLLTTLGTATGWATGDRLGVSVTPTTIAVFRNGAQVGSTYSNSTFGTATRVGFRHNSNTTFKVSSLTVKMS